MTTLFYVSAIIAVISALMAITRASAMHALVYLVVLFLAIASIFLTLGAPFVAVLQIVVYAGAIIVLFVFAVMMLDQGREAQHHERGLIRGKIWIVPVILASILLVQLRVALFDHSAIRNPQSAMVVGPKLVGISLFTHYLIGVELASFMLLAGLVAAFHYGLFSNREEQDDG